MCAHPGGEEHEGKLSALADRQRQTARTGRAKPLPAAEHVEDHALHDEQTGDEQKDVAGPLDEETQIERHSDGGEEHAEQQAFERLYVRLELMAVGGLGEQGARQKCAERGGKAGVLHDERHAYHGQQRGRRHRLPDLRTRDQPENVIEQEVPDDHDGGNGEQRLPRHQQIHARAAAGREGEQRNAGR